MCQLRIASTPTQDTCNLTWTLLCSLKFDAAWCLKFQSLDALAR